MNVRVWGFIFFLLFAACSNEKETKVQYVEKTETPESPGVRPVPTPTPGGTNKKPDVVDLEKLTTESRLAMQAILANEVKVNDQLPSDQMARTESLITDMMTCTFTISGPLCDEYQAVSYDDFVIAKLGIFYVNHFGLTKDNVTYQYLSVVPLKDAKSPVYREMYLFSVDELFERPVSFTELQNRHTLLATFNLSREVIDQAFEKIKVAGSAAEIYYLAHLIKRIRSHTGLSESDKDQLATEITLKLPVFLNENDDKLKDIAELLVTELELSKEETLALGEEFLGSSDPDLAQLAKAMVFADRQQEYENSVFEGLQHSWWLVRYLSLQALANVDEMRDNDQAKLLELIADEDAEIARMAYEYSKSIELDNSHFKVLEEAIDSENLKTRELAVFAAAKCLCKEGAELLAENLDEKDIWLGDIMTELLEGMAANPDLLRRQRRTLVEHLNHVDKEVRKRSAKLLRYIPSKWTLKDLEERWDFEQNLEAPESSTELKLIILETIGLVKAFLNAPSS